MHQFYSFDFFQTITDQLRDRLGLLDSTPLDDESLAALRIYQAACGSAQGVYCLVYENLTVYVGKADRVDERLAQHLAKVRGRQNIDLAKVCYKAILLDRSMSTAANEKLLIQAFQAQHECEWNGSGFGTKDPGKERDTTRPNLFDQRFPIRADFLVSELDNTETLDSLLGKMKLQLPYVVRWQALTAEQKQIVIDLNGVSRDAESLLRLAGQALGIGWQAVILSNGIILYRNQTTYVHGRTVYP